MIRLHKNTNGYYGDRIDIDSILLSCQNSAHMFNWEVDTILHSNPAHIIALRKFRTPASKNVYISSGIHGDEPAGPLAIDALLHFNNWPPNVNLWVIPCLNPTGFAKGTRENADNIDLNRDYFEPKTAEVKAHTKWLDTQSDFDLTICIHEDWESEGFYIYGNTEPIVSAILQAVRSILPIESNLKVGESNVVNGIVQVSEAERMKIHPEAFYLIERKKGIHFTLETPSDYQLEERVSAHVIAINTALRTFMLKGS